MKNQQRVRLSDSKMNYDRTQGFVHDEKQDLPKDHMCCIHVLVWTCIINQEPSVSAFVDTIDNWCNLYHFCFFFISIYIYIILLQVTVYSFSNILDKRKKGEIIGSQGKRERKKEYCTDRPIGKCYIFCTHIVRRYLHTFLFDIAFYLT